MTTAATLPANAPEPLAYGYDELTAVVGLGRRTIERMVSMGEFPAPRKRGKRTLFLADEVRAWLQQLPKARKN
jgi:excisionase family DNA binding protein